MKMLPVWARLASTSTGLRAYSPIASGSHQPRRQVSSSAPAILQPMMQYASECNITVGLQTSMEAIHSMGMPWAGAIVVSGIVLRVTTAPLHIYAERLFARRLHATNFFTQKIINILGKKYNCKVAPNAEMTKLELKTDNSELAKAADKYLTENVTAALLDQRLQASRIQNLKMASVPVWMFSSFAIRNIISSDFHPSIAGGLWVPDLLMPDPYFIIPVSVGIVGFLNLWSQRKIYPAIGHRSPMAIKSYDALLAFFTCFAVHIMTQMPACIPLYWLSISVTGFAQAQLLRHPKVKKILGIQSLPTDSATPLRDIFLMRKKL
ncbi:cox-18 [Pristionchus pacificus]|nr:cox-18 [Pristionchus pacificus]